MTLTVSETCYHCLHADFKAEANGTMKQVKSNRKILRSSIPSDLIKHIVSHF